jgi:uncharacterized lipoprotein YddW (UPF0748 family)
MLLRLLACATLLALLPASLKAQDLPAVKHDFRGAWIATVVNLDWPSSRTASTAAQKAELVDMLDELKAAGVNAVMFQIRTEADAFYGSPYEPWSYWLTGEQGKAPDPYYDPLEFAIEEAHKRGMELHAWFNPYRAERSVGDYQLHASHPKVENPDWILTTGPVTRRISILDPGIPAVRDYVRSIILDVVERYDVDGIHFDDYFYPYEGIGSVDADTYNEYGGSFSNIQTWRLYNINMLIRGVHEDLEQSSKPWMVFGVSPFGIWRSGTPPGIVGLSAVDAIYADAVNWLDQQWVDYLAPQLYWAFGGGQDYAKLAPWWMSVANERHMYMGLGAYRAASQTNGSVAYSADELPRQIRFNRREGVQGQIIFRAENVTRFSSLGFADSLQQNLWTSPALTPIMDWRDQTAPGKPGKLTSEPLGDDFVRLNWSAPEEAEGEAETRRYAVYRFRSNNPPPPSQLIWDANNLIGVTGETSFVDRPVEGSVAYYYFVASVSANSIESAPSNMIQVLGRAVSTEEPSAETTLALQGASPNPFASQTSIRFYLAQPSAVSVTVYDVLGREVASLVQDEVRSAGDQSVTFEAGSLPSGTYLVVLEAEGRRLVKPMLHVR